MFGLSSKKSCPYDKCGLPEHNYKYVWQEIYTAFGLFVLYQSQKDFNFFQTFLFLTPIMIDIAYTGLKNKGWNILRCVLGILNAIFLLACVMGMTGILVDTGESFAMRSGALYFQNIQLKKTMIGKIMAANLAVPIVYLVASPCQKTMKSITEYTEMEGVRQ